MHSTSFYAVFCTAILAIWFLITKENFNRTYIAIILFAASIPYAQGLRLVISRRYLYLDESSGSSSNVGSPPTVFRRLENFSATKVLTQLKRMYFLYVDSFGVRGQYFILKAAVFEMAELILQMSALVISFDIMDMRLASWILIVVVINAIISPLLYYKRNKAWIIAADALLDLIYTILNITKLLNNEEELKFVDFTSLVLPLVSITFLIFSYAEWQITQTDAMAAWRRGVYVDVKVGSSAFPLPLVAERARKMFLLFRNILSSICCVVGTFACVYLIRITHQHSICVEKYSRACGRVPIQGYIFLMERGGKSLAVSRRLGR